MIVSTECRAYPAVLRVLSGFARDGFAIVAQSCGAGVVAGSGVVSRCLIAVILGRCSLCARAIVPNCLNTIN